MHIPYSYTDTIYTYVLSAVHKVYAISPTGFYWIIIWPSFRLLIGHDIYLFIVMILQTPVYDYGIKPIDLYVKTISYLATLSVKIQILFTTICVSLLFRQQPLHELSELEFSSKYTV